MFDFFDKLVYGIKTERHDRQKKVKSYMILSRGHRVAFVRYGTSALLLVFLYILLDAGLYLSNTRT